MDKQLDFNSIATSNGSDDDSSLNVLDLNVMPEARKSTSFIHVSNKTSSIDSWLDQCFSVDNQDKSQNSNFNSNESNRFSSDAIPYSKKPFETDVESGDEDKSLCAFDFDAEELDLDLLINEDEEQNHTLTSADVKKFKNQESFNCSFNSEKLSFQGSNSSNNAFDERAMDQLGDFLGFGCQMNEFQDQLVCDNEQFASAGDAENIISKEEEYFEKENQFKLNENFDVSIKNETNPEFSVCRTSNFFDLDNEGGKVSIGTYMGSRSEKLGKLGKDSFADRPSFGLKVKTPNAQKENDKLVASNDSPLKNKNESVNQSLIVTLSKALSDMSASLSSGELAEFLVELSKKKKASSVLDDLAIEKTIESQSDDVTCIEKSTLHSLDNTNINCENLPEKDISEKYFLPSTPLQNDATSHLLSEESKVLTPTLSKITNELSTSSSTINSFPLMKELSNEETLTNSNCDFSFLPGCENSFCPNILSSTKDNFSFRSESMNRESIAKYHHNIRAQADDQDQGMLNFVTAPSEILFENLLCIGVPSKGAMPLQNKSASLVQIDLRCISISINGKEPLFPYEDYICMKRKLMLRPYGYEESALYLIGLEPGKYEIILEVLSSLVLSENTQNIKTKCSSYLVQVNATVHHPSVLIECDLDNHLQRRSTVDFGQVIYGSSKSMQIHLQNKSKFAVPVCLLLSMPGLDNCHFSLSLSSQAFSDREKPSKQLKIVLNANRESLVWLHFNSYSLSPSSEYFINESLDKVQGQLQVLLDAPFTFNKTEIEKFPDEKVLDTVQLNCLVGFCKLHAPTNKQVLTFMAEKGKSVVKKIPIKNVGNMSVQVHFSFDDKSNSFKLDPECATLPSGKEVLLTVTFSPSTSSANASSNTSTNTILMNILPNGPQFEVQIYGFVLPSLSRKSAPSSKSSPCLLTNKTQLQWGGVPLLSSRKQKLLLRSIDTSLPVQCQCSVTGEDSSCFSLSGYCWSSEKFVQSRNISVLPGKDQPVFIVFSPNSQKICHAKLEIKTPVDNVVATKYTIPLTGYGGTSQIAIENMTKTPVNSKFTSLQNDSWNECYLASIEGSSAKIALRNCGCRSAFVKLVAFKDAAFKVAATSTIFYPSQFVLKAQQSKVVLVKVDFSTLELLFVCILHGDELSRILMRKLTNINSSVSNLINRYIPQSQAYLRYVSFNEAFDEENLFSESSIEEIGNDLINIKMFYYNLRQTLVELRSKDLVVSVPSSDNSTSNLSVFDIPVRDVGLDAKQQEYTTSKDKLSVSPHWSWTLSPQCVSLDVATPQNRMKADLPEPAHVKLKNVSSSTLFFDVVWPGHYLTVTPQHGLVETGSTVPLLINANPSLSAVESVLPWCGQIIVLATDCESKKTSRTIFVQIKKKFCFPDFLSHDNQGKSTAQFPSIESPSTTKAEITLLSDLLVFDAVRVSCCSKLKFEFQNRSLRAIKWALSSVAPAYIKSHSYNDPANIYRCSYAPFVFSSKSGFLRRNEWARVEVTFNPLSVGAHTQLWEIEYYHEGDVDAVTLDRSKIQLKGEVKTSTSKRSLGSAEKLTLPQSSVYVSEDCYWFPDTSMSRTSLIRIPVKNRGKSSETVRFILPLDPFYIAQQNYAIKSMCCANLPVTFKPSKPGFFSEVLVIQSSYGSISLTLKANAFAK